MSANPRELFAILRVDPEIFRLALGLPDTVEVIGVEKEPGTRGVLHVQIIGAGSPVPPGARIPIITGIALRRYDSGHDQHYHTFDWGFAGSCQHLRVVDSLEEKSGVHFRCEDCGMGYYADGVWRE
jgi:hypothetical protein